MTIPLAFQLVSSYCALPYSYQFLMTVLGSLESEWLLCLAYFMLDHDGCSWLSRL